MKTLDQALTYLHTVVSACDGVTDDVTFRGAKKAELAAALRAVTESLALAGRDTERLTKAADELGNMLFRFDTVADALQKVLSLGGTVLSDSAAKKHVDAMRVTTMQSRKVLADLNAAIDAAMSAANGGAK